MSDYQSREKPAAQGGGKPGLKDPKADPKAADSDGVTDRNNDQVNAILRGTDKWEESSEDPKSHGAMSSKRAELVLQRFPPGAWLLRRDRARRVMMVSVKDGKDHVEHRMVQAEAVSNAALRPYDRNKMVPFAALRRTRS